MKQCKICEGENPDKAKKCISCGNKFKKPIYKRGWFILLTIFCILRLNSIISTEINSIKRVLYVEKLISEIGEVTLDSKFDIQKAEKATRDLEEKDLKRFDKSEEIDNARDEYNMLVESQEIERFINEIGDVTLDSDARIKSIRVRYDNISESAKAEVSNYDVFEKAEKDIFDLKVDVIVEAINQIGEVNSYSTESISNARNLYDDAEDDIKNAIHNYEILETAITKFSEVVVNDIINNINSIGTVSIDSKELIESISKVYELLPNEDKQKITNIDLLEQAKIRFTEVEKEYINTRKNALISKMTIEEDKVLGTIWYHSKSTPQYINTRSYALPYIGVNGNKIFLRLKLDYTDDDWIFFDNITIDIDGQNITRSFNYFDIERGNAYGDVWETYDMQLSTDSDIQIIRDIVNSNETIIRFNGKYGKRYDLTISASDRQATAEVLELYDLLKK